MKYFILMLLFFASANFKTRAQQTQQIYLSGRDKDHTVNWKFYCTTGRNSGKWTTIPVPSDWELQGFGDYTYGNHPKHTNVQGHYKYSFTAPASWKGKVVRIVFEGVKTDATVKVNGHLAGPTHTGGFYIFSYDISNLVHYGKQNLLQVSVRKWSTNKSVRDAESGDFWSFGGIYRPVYLQVKPKKHIKRVAIEAKASGKFTAHVFTNDHQKGASVVGQIYTLGGKKVGSAFKVSLNPQAPYQTLSTTLANTKQWSPEFPNLYSVVFKLKDRRGHLVHKVKKRFGFRTVELRKGLGFYINGKKVRFKGVDYHSFWPSSGRALSKERVIKDVNLMKDMNMNAVRLSHYPRTPYFYNVCDSLGIFVADELTGWQASYNTKIGRKLVKEMVTTEENHPSIIMWNNGNEGGYNFALDKYFDKWDIQNRPVNHPGAIFKDLNSEHYPSYQALLAKLTLENKIVFPDEFLHALYAGGGGAGLQDYWNLMLNSPRSAGGFIWMFADGCVERTDKGGRLDCAGNRDPDGIVGPYRGKSGSFYAIKQIWSPVQIKKDNISSKWNGKLWVGNRFFYTNLNQVQFTWKLLDYPGPFNKAEKAIVVDQGNAASPDVAPQSSGFLQLHLPAGWKETDALSVKATDPHGQEIYRWTLPIKKQRFYVNHVIGDTSSKAVHIKQTSDQYILHSKKLTVTIYKKSGYINQIQKGGKIYSLNSGPFLVGDSSSLKSIKKDGKNIVASFSKDNYEVTYSLVGGWLKINYSYRPVGKYPYFGISFDYPEKKVKGIKWLGHGPDRVWKNRLAGARLGLWHRRHKKYPDEIATHGYYWHLPKFNGYYADLNWAVLNTVEGPITMMVNKPGIYLRLFTPHWPLKPGHAKTPFPKGSLSFLQAIPPIGAKFRKAGLHGPHSQPNLFQYAGYHYPNGHFFKYKNTLWFYFGSQNR